MRMYLSAREIGREREGREIVRGGRECEREGKKERECERENGERNRLSECICVNK